MTTPTTIVSASQSQFAQQAPGPIEVCPHLKWVLVRLINESLDPYPDEFIDGNTTEAPVFTKLDGSGVFFKKDITPGICAATFPLFLAELRSWKPPKEHVYDGEAK